MSNKFPAAQKTIRRDRFSVYHCEHRSILRSYQNQRCSVNPANCVHALTLAKHNQHNGQLLDHLAEDATPTFIEKLSGAKAE